MTEHACATSPTIQAWLENRHGQLALERLRELIVEMTKNWRTNSRVLVCGHLLHYFAPALAGAGFQVTCAGETPQIARAGKLNDKRLDLHIAPLDHLPFSRHEFDATLVLLAFSPRLPLPAVQQEIQRVTRREAVLTALNRSSLFYRKRHVLGPEADSLQWVTWREIKDQLYDPERIALQKRSILQGFPAAWALCPRQLDNLPLPLGAFLAVRATLRRKRLKTPLIEKIKEHALLQTNQSEVYNRSNLGRHSSSLSCQSKDLSA